MEYYHTNRHRIGEQVKKRRAERRRQAKQNGMQFDTEEPIILDKEEEEPRMKVPNRRNKVADVAAGHYTSTITKRYDAIPVPDGLILWRGDQPYYVHRGTPPLQATMTQAPRQTPRLLAAPGASEVWRTTRPQELPQMPKLAKPAEKQRRWHKLHWLILVGLAFLVMILSDVALNTLASWWHTHNDDMTYGRPRTFQINAVIGHQDSTEHPSHFIAMNLNRHIMIIEIPGGDPSRAIIYNGGLLVGDGQDLAPVTLSFVDSRGTGKPDMQVHVNDQTITFINNGTKFVSPPNLVSGGSNPPNQGE